MPAIPYSGGTGAFLIGWQDEAEKTPSAAFGIHRPLK